MTKNIKTIMQLVKKEADHEDWQYHILPVLQYAKKLAKIYKANQEIVELAAILHDIGRIRFGDEDHELTGARAAEKILQAQRYSEKVIAAVKECIRSHRGSKDIPLKSIEAKIIANADAMSHFDTVPVLFYWITKRERFEESLQWVDEKIERDWQKKITLPAAKIMMRKKYEAVRIVLNANKQYLDKKR
ncbi:MAG: HD domain-containing protein [Nanoarchaeota archaeon]